jgi:hypothetical protein
MVSFLRWKARVVTLARFRPNVFEYNSSTGGAVTEQSADHDCEDRAVRSHHDYDERLRNCSSRPHDVRGQGHVK